jgi:hypothetical protein
VILRAAGPNREESRQASGTGEINLNRRPQRRRGQCNGRPGIANVHQQHRDAMRSEFVQGIRVFLGEMVGVERHLRKISDEILRGRRDTGSTTALSWHWKRFRSCSSFFNSVFWRTISADISSMRAQALQTFWIFCRVECNSVRYYPSPRTRTLKKEESILFDPRVVAQR